MKTKTILLFQLLLFFYFNTFSQSWTDPICDGNDIISAPYYERSCSYSSDAFNNYWKMLSGDYYVPDNHTPTKTILVNFNVFLDNNGQNNYPNNQSTLDKFNSIISRSLKTF